MKVIYEFDPIEDRDELDTFIQAKNMSIAIHEFREYLRKIIKYESETYLREEFDERGSLANASNELFDTQQVEAIRSEFFRILDEAGVKE